MLVDGPITPPTARGRYTWSALLSPPVAGSSVPDPSRAAEVRATVPLPQRLTLRTSYDAKKKSALLTGTFTVLGEPRADVSVSFVASALRLGRFLVLRACPNGQGGQVLHSQNGRAVHPLYGLGSLSVALLRGTVYRAPRLSQRDRHVAGLRVGIRDPPQSRPIPSGRSRSETRSQARRANLQRSDVPAAWNSEPAEDAGAPLCEKFAPNLSRLTITGTGASPVFFSEAGGAWSEAWVYRTEAEARVAFERLARLALPTCLANELREQEVDVRVSPLSFPKLAPATRAFRLSAPAPGRNDHH